MRPNFNLHSPSRSNLPQIHISKAEAPEEDPKLVGKAVKLMHRFDPDQIEAKMDQVECKK